MTTSRPCQDCGTDNLADAEYCAACGNAIDTAGVERPWLAALAGTDDASSSTAAPITPESATPDTAASEAPVTPKPVPATRPPAAAVATGATIGHERPWLAPTIAVFVVIALAATLIALLASSRSDTDQPATSATPTTEPTRQTDTTVAPTSAPDTTVPETAPTTTDPGVAATELAAIAQADRDRVISLEGRWVPQLSAKEDGTEWEGVVYDLPAILDLHRQLGDQVGDTLLVEGTTLAFLIDGERMAGWWITLADQAFDDADGALDWCADAGFDRANCAARFLTDDDTATGTLRLQSS